MDDETKQVSNWLYIDADITEQELASIQQEILDKLEEILPGWKTKKGQYATVNQALVADSSPTLRSFLSRIGLLNRWTESVVISVNHTSEVSWPIHVDDFRLQRRVALNIPIINCENSFTTWYDVTAGSEANGEAVAAARRHGLNGAGKSHSIYYHNEGAVEIGRRDGNKASFINVAIPHRPVPGPNVPRIVLSVRFWPEITDYFKND